MYRADHIKVLKVLGSDVPKRTQFKVSQIVTVGFRGVENADRRVRNAMRKLRADEVVEICDRGEYRLTTKGGSAVLKWQKEGWPVKERAHTEKLRKRDAKMAEVKPAKTKPVGKAVKAVKTSKKVKVVVKSSPKRGTRKTEVKSESAEKGNTRPPEKTQDTNEHQLAF